MATEKTPSPTQLYVSNLPFAYGDEDLQQIFSEFKVRKAYVATRRNGRSKGFGFVDLENEEEQQKALQAVNDLELEGRRLMVSVAHRDPRRDESGVMKEEFRTELPKRARPKRDSEPVELSDTVVYVANIPFSFEESDLEQLFSEYQPVTVKIARRRNRSKGFAFVELPNKEMQTASLALDGRAIGDDERIISVKVSKVIDLSARSPAAPRRNAPQRDAADLEPSDIAVYVSNLPFDLSDEGLEEIFTERGVKPVRAHVARRRGTERSKGFGFVVFANNADQQTALAATQDVTVSDRTLSVKVARKGSEMAPEERERAPRKTREPREPRERRPPREKVPSETLVYVSNLSFDLDDEQLGLLFSEFNVKSAYVARRRNNRSKGFGFVEFNSHDDQQRALSKNGVTVADREISVEVAQQPAKE